MARIPGRTPAAFGGTVRWAWRAAMVVAGLGLAPLPAVQAQPLTTEAQLERAETAQAIESFWQRQVSTGDFTGRRGVRIAFAKALQPDRATEKGALVIVSGRTESMLKYKELVHDLWNDGWSVYLHDHRGQGLSEREPEVKDAPQKGHVHDFQDFVNDLRRFMAGQVLAGGHGRHVLLAHSMGGAIAALFLQQGGDEVRRLDAAVLSSPMLRIKGVGGAPADILSCRVAKDLARRAPSDYIKTGDGYRATPFADNELTHSAVRYERLLRQYEEVPAIRLGSPTHRWFDQACEAAFRARTGSSKVRTPVRVVVAGADTIVHNSGAAEFCRGLPAASGGCGGTGGGPIEVAGARHELLIEQDDMRRQALVPVLSFFAASRRGGRP